MRKENLGTGTDRNVVAGNFIGTDVSGTAALGNNWQGVRIHGGAAHNLVGTDADGVADEAERNVTSGNGVGVALQGEAAFNVSARSQGAAAARASGIEPFRSDRFAPAGIAAQRLSLGGQVVYNGRNPKGLA